MVAFLLKIINGVFNQWDYSSIDYLILSLFTWKILIENAYKIAALVIK